jgi:hypothetical protein
VGKGAGQAGRRTVGANCARPADGHKGRRGVAGTQLRGTAGALAVGDGEDASVRRPGGGGVVVVMVCVCARTCVFAEGTDPVRVSRETRGRGREESDHRRAGRVGRCCEGREDEEEGRTVLLETP